MSSVESDVGGVESDVDDVESDGGGSKSVLDTMFSSPFSRTSAKKKKKKKKKTGEKMWKALQFNFKAELKILDFSSELSLFLFCVC